MVQLTGKLTLHFDNGLTTTVPVSDREMETMVKHLRGEAVMVKLSTTDGGQLVFNRHKLTAAAFSPEPVQRARKSRAKLALKPAEPVIKTAAAEPPPDFPGFDAFDLSLDAAEGDLWGDV